MGIGNKDTYLQYKKLADMIPELSELVDTGITDPYVKHEGVYMKHTGGILTAEK